jgi:AcrR family transcriptional regulator
MTESNEPASGLSRRRYGGVSAEARQGQRRERLLDAALEVFGIEGYARATMRLVCAKARLTERYFYEQFTGLDDVFQILHQQLSEGLIESVAQAYALHLSHAADDRLRACLRAFFQYIQDDPRRARILLMDAVFTGRTDVMDKTTTVQRLVQLLKHRIGQMYPGALDQVDVELIAGGIVGMVIHTATIWAARGFSASIDQIIDHNLYAWRGLDGWLGDLDAAVKAVALTTTPPPAGA